ncbi:unnamed protein product [Brassicogethes aeneus]|uniref:SET domain-containing protein n=1 Tax=Brassicogethes aeneus TaxID=1431903 RepID=A0A9P0BL46_BRAAE|nr:unnamed protein product [Brassicogethes aeneus]
MYQQFADKTFMSICSEKTLQTNEKGFFLTFADLVAEKAGENWIKNVFGALKTDRERIRIIYEAPETRDTVLGVLSNVQEIYRKKSLEISVAKRIEAENAAKNNDMQKSLILFSQSILRAPNKGDALVLALLGRSKILVQETDYDLALNDLQLALKEGLPGTLKIEAFWRMGICYKALKEVKKSNVAFRIAEQFLGSDKKNLNLEADKNREYAVKKKVDRKVEPALTGGPHKEYQNASKKISVKRAKGLGRYVVANEGVKTGETLVVESPYSACLLPEMFGTHCYHCFERFLAPIACQDCSNVAFCSTLCRDEAKYHQYECKYLELMIGSGMSILAHTSLRMITQNSLGKILDIYNDRSKEKVYSLCTNSTIRCPEDFLQRTLMAAFLLRCLQKSGYFGDTEKVHPSEQELKIGELLLYHLQMLQFNAHEIYETRHTPENRFRESRAAYIGVSVYPTVSLFNHDCCPTVARYFVGKKIVIKALRPLAPNNVVAENYGPVFTRKTLAERQRSLSSRYWFSCQCEACRQNWPSLSTGLDNVGSRVKCSNKKCINYFTLPVSNIKLKCPKCENIVDLTENINKLKWCFEQYEIGFKALDEQNPELGIKILCPAIDAFYKISLYILCNVINANSHKKICNFIEDKLKCSDHLPNVQYPSKAKNLELNNIKWVLDFKDLFEKFPNVTNVTIYSGSIEKLVPPNSNTKLETLQLKNLRIKQISDDFFLNFTGLKTLNLEGNLLDGFGENVTFGNISELYLSNNKWNCTKNLTWALKYANIIKNQAGLFCEFEPYPRKPLFPIARFLEDLEVECPNTCNCALPKVVQNPNSTRWEPLIHVNCSGRGLKGLPHNIPNETMVLHLENNEISNLDLLRTSRLYRSVTDLFLDNNTVDSIDDLEGSYWLSHFRVLSLSGNRLTELPSYALDNALTNNPNAFAVQVSLGGNPWRCDCIFTPGFQELLQKYATYVKDLREIKCSYVEGDENSLLPILDISRSSVCRYPNEYSVQEALDLLNAVLASLIVFVLGKLAYDYYHFKKTGKLPWIVTKIP